MSKKYKNIDALFQAELGASTLKAPAHVKANIDKAIKDKRFKKFYFFLIPALLLAVLIPTGIYITSNQAPEINGLSSIDGNSDTASNEQSSKTTSSDLNVSPVTLINDENLQEHQNEKVSSIIDSENILNNQDKIDSPTAIDIKSGSTNKQQTNNGSSKTKSTGEMKVDATKKNDPFQQKESGFVESGVILSSNQDSKTPIDEEKTILRNEDFKEIADVKNQNNDNPDLKTTSITSKTDSIPELLPIDSNIEKEDVVEADSNTSPAPLPLPIPIEREDKYKGWMVGIHGGGLFKQSHILGADTATENFYSSSIKDKSGYAIGVNANYRLKNGLLFGAGAQLSSYQEKYDFQKFQNVIVDTTFTWVVTVDSIQDSSMVWIPIYDSSYVSNYVYGKQAIVNAQGNNQATYLHIPLRFGVQFIQNKWRFDFLVQGRFNLLLQSRTTHFENNQLITTSGNAFKNSYLDLELGANVHYNLWKNLFVSGIVKYRPPLNNTYYSSGLSNKLQSLYLGIGFNWNF